ncbi:MAG TPA: HAD family hydrolase [Terriglobales bacterium]|nr:HAD family hydrolase [Terriglobales bacterium]
MNVKAIVIDMDGTITNFNLDYMAARRRALEELERLNLRTPEFNEQVNLYVILNKLKTNMDSEAFAKLKATFYSYFEQMETKAAQEVTLFPGANDTLRKIRSQSIKLGLVTNNGRAGTNTTLKRLRLDGLFDSVVTRDDCEEMKPDSAPIRKVLNELQVDSSEAILVGDGVMDIMAAKATGLVSVAVATGPFPSERILRAEPDYFLGSINDVPTLIDQLKSERPS